MDEDEEEKLLLAERDLYRQAKEVGESRRLHVYVAFMKLEKLMDSPPIDVEAVRALIYSGLRRRGNATRVLKRRTLREVLKTRTCRKCLKEKPIDQFKTYSSTHKLCRLCHLAEQRDRYHRREAFKKIRDVLPTTENT
jgi:hypothetical protein